jgi:very-short-patch-repair endonuclease
MSNGIPETPCPALSLEIEAVEAVNFSLQQNEVPTIRRVTLRNEGAEALTGLTLRVEVDPPFADPLVAGIEAILAGETLNLDEVDLHLSPSFLDGVSERIDGFLRVTVHGYGRELVSARRPIGILARNEWSALFTPGLLASFVLPNDPGVAKVLRRASEIVGAREGMLSGYQEGDREAAAAQLAAIYEAVAELRIGYVSIAASFEGTGQKIRTPTEVLGHGLGNCLDLTVLLAACAEQCGLHPLVLVHEGHAYFGCWLDEKGLAAESIDDRSAIRKRSELGELVVLESTLLANAEPAPIDRAQAAGKAHLTSQKEFLFAVDVVRARKAGFRPLPNMGEPAAPPRLPDAPRGTGVGGEIEVRDPLELRPAEARGPRTRLDIWKAKLLDLSLRNRLLNFRETGGATRLLAHDLGALENALEDGKRLWVRPLDHCVRAKGPGARNGGGIDPEEVPAEILEGVLEENMLASACLEEEHVRRMTRLYRGSRNDLEETGSNSLFLAFGMLRWRTPEGPARELRAPILLMPVELRRKSMQEGYVLGAYDEETRINSSLLEMLRQHFGKEIPGVDPLPEDENGVDVRRVLDLMREALKDLPGWEIEDECWLGQFSFAKYLLWKDLADRAGLLTRNRVVAQLVQRPGEPFPAAEREEEPLDRRMDTKPVLTTRSSDSSQLAAVVATADGGDFVLEGPPGTGKSQTITNMIAHSLSQGKRVLFVAEKRAALEVVHRRLVEDGMGPFCLELHSNKAGKLEVLRQLEATMKLGRLAAPGGFDTLRSQLAEARDRLNAYAEGLNERLACGLSAYDCLSYLAAEREGATLTAGPSAELLGMTEVNLARRREIATRLGERLAPVAPANLNPLRGVGLAEWSPDIEAEAEELLLRLEAAAKAAAGALAEASSALAIANELRSHAGLAVLRKLAEALPAIPCAAGKEALDPGGHARGLGWEFWEGWLGSRDTARAGLAGYDEVKLGQLDARQFEKAWADSATSWWPLRWWTRFRVRGALGSARAGGERPNEAAAGDAVTAAANLARAKDALGKAQTQGQGLFGPGYKGGEIPLATVRALRSWIEAMEATLTAATRLAPMSAPPLRNSLGELLPLGKAALGEGSRLGEASTRLSAALAALDEAWQAAASHLALERATVEQAGDAAEAARECATRLRSSLGKLRMWAAWQRVRREATEAGMEAFVSELGVRESTPSEGVAALHERSLLTGLLKAALGRHPALGRFDGAEHRETIRRFRELDGKVQGLSQQALAAAMAEDVRSALADPRLSGEQAVLNHEIGKKRRHLPIRKLMAKAPNLISRLKPAMLMSPLSVAQFLDAALPPFDLVVFDEASQIPVWDAIGAIARGTQLIVVGDPKQLPPTSFFASAGSDEEPDEAEALLADLESILDELLRCKLPHRRLQWHYRSRHEGLITFSNRLYYESDLMTFPSNRGAGGGVSLHRLPDAVYDKGGSRTNEGEARALVEFLVGKLTDPEGGKLSYGVVTFSQAQQELVENLLEKARLSNPALERHFGEECPVRSEPVFVKNLENVQGDERDVILFSVCYGPDRDGKVSMNFGPLNQAGGERRLNVAVTRAKEAIHVFTCLKPEMIDLRRTGAKGVADLRSFLDYAERGAAVLPSAGDGRRARPASGFVRMVEAHLRGLGFETRLQVGDSSYRVDIGVVDPANPGNYLLGIECDGDSYASARTARDRDKLREAVLGGLGWKLHRVWSTDWWFDPKAEMRRLEEALGSARVG